MQGRDELCRRSCRLLRSQHHPNGTSQGGNGMRTFGNSIRKRRSRIDDREADPGTMQLGERLFGQDAIDLIKTFIDCGFSNWIPLTCITEGKVNG